MTDQILEVGDTLEVRPGERRMIYLGDNIAQMQFFYPKSGEWRAPEAGAKPGPLNEAQIKFWLGKKYGA